MSMKDRNIGLDVIKGIAAILVCMLHFLHAEFGFVNGETIYIPNLTKIFYGFCACSVPLFFMVNGTLILHRNLRIKKICVKILNLLKIRFVWGLVLGLLICGLQYKTISLSNLLSASFYLWFFEALAVIYLFLILWNRINIYRWSIAIPIIIFIHPFLTNLVGLCIAAYTGNTYGNLGHSGFFRLYSLLYFLLPMYLDKIKLPHLINILMILSGLLIVAFEVFVWSNLEGIVYEGMNACFPTVGALLMTVGIYSSLRQLNFKSNNLTVRYLSWLGRNCLGIYLFHMPIIVCINRFMQPQSFNLLINIFSCLIISAICGYLYKILNRFSLISWCLKI